MIQGTVKLFESLRLFASPSILKSPLVVKKHAYHVPRRLRSTFYFYVLWKSKSWSILVA